ncbi:hypothetical protein B9Z44_07065 [Limnohabitans curvus]|uniref:Uncharacterized protein n=2 Tax=Limnohabitans curvus TaxID=323423 RepID=A0A315ER82_9BURK|nr:hypothetical protein B9Z44_07065 [Limnohabitans curvus]
MEILHFFVAGISDILEIPIMITPLTKAVEKLLAAKPASGLRPETDAEWLALQQANEVLAYEIFRSGGMPSADARVLAQALFGGSTGRELLDIALAVEVK